MKKLSNTEAELKKEVLWISRIGVNLKGALEGLRQFLISESPLKIMNIAFYFTILFYLKFLLWLFGHVEKAARLEW